MLCEKKEQLVEVMGCKGSFVRDCSLACCVSKFAPLGPSSRLLHPVHAYKQRTQLRPLPIVPLT